MQNLINKKDSDSSNYVEEIDLLEFFNILWGAKKTIVILTIISAISSVIYALSIENKYKSEAVLTINSSENTAFSQYSGIASLAGIGLTNASSDPSIEMIEILKSREFVKHLMQFDKITPKILASKSYDRQTGLIIYDSEVYDASTGEWIREPSQNTAVIPSHLEVHEAYLKNVLSVSKDKETGLIAMSVEHVSPIFAKDFLNLIIKEANSIKRQKDIDAADKAIVYLELELTKTPVLEIKESIGELLQKQLEIKMIANVNEEYKLETIDSPFIPEKKSYPSRAMICIFLTIVGGIFSVLIVLFRHFFLEKPKKT